MISECMKKNSGFGICLISEGREVGEAATTQRVGTLAKITDWHMRHDKLLGITVNGQQRFRIVSVKVQPDNLSVARVELIQDETEVELPDNFLPLVNVLTRLLDQVDHHYETLPRKYGDANWVSYRLSELLPISLQNKQHLLEMDSPIKRLEFIFTLLEGMEIR
jgi:Lon protease-like protein